MLSRATDDYFVLHNEKVVKGSKGTKAWKTFETFAPFATFVAFAHTTKSPLCGLSMYRQSMIKEQGKCITVCGQHQDWYLFFFATIYTSCTFTHNIQYMEPGQPKIHDMSPSQEQRGVHITAEKTYYNRVEDPDKARATFEAQGYEDHIGDPSRHPADFRMMKKFHVPGEGNGYVSVAVQQWMEGQQEPKQDCISIWINSNTNVTEFDVDFTAEVMAEFEHAKNMLEELGSGPFTFTEE